MKYLYNDSRKCGQQTGSHNKNIQRPEKYPLAKRGTTFYMKLKQFPENCEQFFDIKCGDGKNKKPYVMSNRQRRI